MCKSISHANILYLIVLHIINILYVYDNFFILIYWKMDRLINSCGTIFINWRGKLPHLISCCPHHNWILLERGSLYDPDLIWSYRILLDLDILQWEAHITNKNVMHTTIPPWSPYQIIGWNAYAQPLIDSDRMNVSPIHQPYIDTTISGLSNKIK